MTFAIVIPSLIIIIWLIVDRVQQVHPIRRVYPIVWIGILRRHRRRTGPGSLPFNSNEIRHIRTVATSGEGVTSFGSDVTEDQRYPLVKAPFLASRERARLMPVVVPGAHRDVEMPVLNFGALGLGPVSAATIQAVNMAAAQVGCLANTGEDGLTRIHRAGGARLIWQVGTGYWGCRDEKGDFSREAFVSAAALPGVAMIEVKVSQGAKPGHGGLLPAAKNTPYVASLLGVPPNVDIVSPPFHSAFQTLEQMVRFIDELRVLSGKPVGIKFGIGSCEALEALVDAFDRTGVVPSFLNVDGGDGGTGAAYRSLQNHTVLSSMDVIPLLDGALRSSGLRDRTALFAAGRVKDGYDLYQYLCLGADGCFFTRAPLIAMGCVQARMCHTGRCPTGIATNATWRRDGITPETQGAQLAAYYRTVIAECEALLQASGCRDQGDLGRGLLLPRSGDTHPLDPSVLSENRS